MFKFISNSFNKVNLYLKSIFTPRQRDIAILAGLGIISVWIGMYSPLLLGIYATIFTAAFALTASIFYFIERKSILPQFKKIFTNNAKYDFSRKIRENSLTLVEAKWLLSPGLFSDAPSIKDHSALLCYAAKYGRKDIVQLLIDNGADIRKKYVLNTPLCEAVENNHVNLIKLLFYKEATFNLLGPLAIAIKKGNSDAFRKLIKLGATDDFNSREKFSLIRHVVFYGQLSMLKIYQEEFGKDLLAIQNKNSNLITSAVCCNQPECLKYLLTNAKDKHLQQTGRSLIDEAYIRGYKEIVKILQSKGQKLGDVKVLNKEKQKWDKCKEKISTILRFRKEEMNRNVPQVIEEPKGKRHISKSRP
jgi:hypothetical protein